MTDPDDSTQVAGFLGQTNESDTSLADASLSEVTGSPGEGNYCVYATAKYDLYSVVCMDDGYLHTCRLFQDSDGQYRAHWGRADDPCPAR